MLGLHLILEPQEVTQLIGSTADMNPSTQCAVNAVKCDKVLFRVEYSLWNGDSFLTLEKQCDRGKSTFCILSIEQTCQK